MNNLSELKTKTYTLEDHQHAASELKIVADGLDRIINAPGFKEKRDALYQRWIAHNKSL